MTKANYIKSNHLDCEYVDLILTNKDPCKDCDILLICMGSCSFQRDSKTSLQCSKYRFILENCLKNAIKVYKRNVKEVMLEKFTNRVWAPLFCFLSCKKV